MAFFSRTWRVVTETAPNFRVLHSLFSGSKHGCSSDKAQSRWNEIQAAICEQDPEDMFGFSHSQSHSQSEVSEDKHKVKEFAARNLARDDFMGHAAKMVQRIPKSRLKQKKEHDMFGSFEADKDFPVQQSQEDRGFVRSASQDKDDIEEAKEEGKPYRRLSTTERRHPPSWYAAKIESLAKQGKVKEAVAVLEEEMLGEDRVRPTPQIFTILITALGRVGYTKKAFSLFNKMKKFGYTPRECVYTSLFNACANSPFQRDGVSRATGLLALIRSKNIDLNLIQYKAAIKAFAVGGDTRTAISLLDETLRRGLAPDPQFLSAAQMAAVADKEGGFTPALQMWNEMRRRHVTPDTFNYNLLLRTVRDCGVADFPGFIDSLPAPPGPALLADPKAHLPAAGFEVRFVRPGQSLLDETKQLTSTNFEKRFEAVKNASAEPGVISARGAEPQHVTVRDARPRLGLEENLTLVAACVGDTSLQILADNKAVLALTSADLQLPQCRLALLGGASGVLTQMTRDGAKPDVITVSLLQENLANSEHADEWLVAIADRLQIALDTSFFNGLISRRRRRGDFDLATATVQELVGRGLTPDKRTFGELAMGCKKRRLGIQLLDDMETFGMEPTESVLSILIKASGMDFGYKRELCEKLQALQLPPSLTTLRNIEAHITKGKGFLSRMERGESVAEFFTNSKFSEDLPHFLRFYRGWLKRSPVSLPEHPWVPFRDVDSGSENVMEADEKLQGKPHRFGGGGLPKKIRMNRKAE